MSIHPETQIGLIHLTISELDRLLEFYQQILGFHVLKSDGKSVYLDAGKGQSILVLTEDQNAKPAIGRTGLYHMAILVPSRFELARSLRKLIDNGWPIGGFADHGVSEAIYLSDPDGNGIEIYRDRKREEWPFRNGKIQMTSDPIDLDGIMEELKQNPARGNGLHPDTHIGHIHLKVANIQDSINFYVGILGFDLIQRFGPSAGFVSAGGYHHHIGFNTWESAGAFPPPPGATGLRYFSIKLPNSEELEKVLDRFKAAQIDVSQHDSGWEVLDPAKNKVVLVAG